MIIKLIILFIYVLALMSFNLLRLSDNDFIRIKIYIFSGIFLFEFILDICIKLYKQQIIDLVQITKNSLESALVATLAYCIYSDMVCMNYSFVDNLDTSNKQNLFVTSLITFAIAISYLINSFFATISPKINDRLNVIYPAK
jgi:hypothetical protein